MVFCQETIDVGVQMLYDHHMDKFDFEQREVSAYEVVKSWFNSEFCSNAKKRIADLENKLNDKFAEKRELEKQIYLERFNLAEACLDIANGYIWRAKHRLGA
jgi:hypothetical protein